LPAGERRITPDGNYADGLADAKGAWTEQAWLRAFVRMADKLRAILVGSILSGEVAPGRTRTAAACQRGIPRNSGPEIADRSSPRGAQTPLLGGFAPAKRRHGKRS
jgi:hypothetical protein